MVKAPKIFPENFFRTIQTRPLNGSKKHTCTSRVRIEPGSEWIKKTHMHQPGIEPGSVPWQGTILPLDHWCLMQGLRQILLSNILFPISASPQISADPSKWPHLLADHWSFRTDFSCGVTGNQVWYESNPTWSCGHCF